MTDAIATRDPAESALAPELAERLRDRVASAHAPATVRAYKGDLRAFSAWCEAEGLQALPAAPATVAAFLDAEARAGRKASTINRRTAAIRYAHRLAGFDPSPTDAQLVQDVARSIRRELTTAPDRKRPITAAVVRGVLDAIDTTTTKGKRDKALLLIGWAGAFRRSELVGLEVDDLEQTDKGLRVTLRRSKTDQEGAGREVAIPLDPRAALCPVSALIDWLTEASIDDGPVFRSVTKSGRVGDGLTARSVANIIKAHVEAAGYDPAQFSGHSLRAGWVTTAAEAGRDVFRIMDQTGHRSVQTVRGYVRRARAFEDHPGAGLL